MKNLKEKLSILSSNLDSILTDESLSNIPKVLRELVQELDDIVDELEDEKNVKEKE